MAIVLFVSDDVNRRMARNRKLRLRQTGTKETVESEEGNDEGRGIVATASVPRQRCRVQL